MGDLPTGGSASRGGRGFAYRGLSTGGVHLGEGVCLQGGSAQPPLPPHPRTRKAGGTHPTGMLSCFNSKNLILVRQHC